jgi:hypothetical protein
MFGRVKRKLSRQSIHSISPPAYYSMRADRVNNMMEFSLWRENKEGRSSKQFLPGKGLALL